jgi:hypothetical protein
MWWGDPTPDQRPSDAFGLVYESAPLEADLEVTGFPVAHLNVSASAPVANWFVRLSDVAPGGAVSLVAGAGFNGTHRESSREPKALVPGQEVALGIEMHFTTWVFPKGHRIRFVVSNAQWPMFWPSPQAMSTTLRLGGKGATRLDLPVIPHAERPVPVFLPPAEDPVLAGFGALEPGPAVAHDGEQQKGQETGGDHQRSGTQAAEIALLSVARGDARSHAQRRRRPCSCRFSCTPQQADWVRA